MNFNKQKFTEKNGEFLYGKLIDFLECEINNRTYENIMYFLSDENTKITQYEGNQYSIVRELNSQEVLVIDEVSEEYGVPSSQSRFVIKAKELVELMRTTT